MAISVQNVGGTAISGVTPNKVGQSSVGKTGGGNTRRKRGPAAIVSVGEGGAAQKSKKGTSKADASNATGTEKLTKEEKKEVRELEKRDRKVRQHEQAHVQAGGQYVKGGPTYEYERGPNGKRYAVGGEVQLDTSEADDPRKTIKKMRAVKRAALAPAEPSQQDRKVASEAQKKIQEAQQKLQEQKGQKIGKSAPRGNANATRSDTKAKSHGSTSQDKTGGKFSRQSPSISPEVTTSTRTGLQNLRVDNLAS